MKKLLFCLLFLLLPVFAFAGPVYKGTLSGDISGPFLASTNPDGSVFILGWSNENHMGSGVLVHPASGGGFFQINLLGVRYEGTVSDDSISVTVSMDGQSASGTGYPMDNSAMLSYAGSYRADLSGDVRGTMDIGISGTTPGALVVDGYRHPDNAYFPGLGIVSDTGMFLAVSQDFYVTIKGQVNGSSISGQWADVVYELFGTFATPGTPAPSPGGSSDSSSSGCFIDNLR
ncbi:hypothetical protein LZ24_03430 [Desulfobotulus alkaliphilus]|uniref:Uncharacterized protein n=1 Tax=Desulfobotulus alkaliphilus TaxID=622671 RepID=A0A562QZ56_9BACT|nr:hypothetical protein [Desulfobotulus alkaliphilus]TWI61614.1 hypothetical protein LZ24_03430 [Desulfobotulus alkaliphilus]